MTPLLALNQEGLCEQPLNAQISNIEQTFGNFFNFYSFI